jgi:hypothetical protein
VCGSPWCAIASRERRLISICDFIAYIMDLASDSEKT